MTPQQIEQCARQLEAFHERVAPLFPDKRQRPWYRRWIHGLLLDGARKNAAELARAVPGGEVQAMQQFLTDSTWPWEPVMQELQAMAQQILGEPDGILVCDDTGFAKKGTDSVGVARQYSGTLGKVDNCQIGVFAAYVGSKGQCVVDGRVYLPRQWTSNRAKRKKAGVPRDVRFRTKPELALEMIERVAAGPLSVRWVACDDGYGRDGGFRRSVADLGLLFVCEVPSDQRVWTEVPAVPERSPGQMGCPRTRGHTAPGAPRSRKVRELVDEIEHWQPIKVREGTKKPIAADWAALRVWPSVNRAPGPERWLLVERSEAGLKYYLSNASVHSPLETMARIAKQEWFVEPCFRDLKQEVGLADYEVRKWSSWYHHVTLCLLAGLFLTMTRTKWAKRGTR
jgi:SRSO17 transposase